MRFHLAGFPAGPFFGGGDSPPKISYSPLKFLLTLFVFTLSPLPLGYSPPPKVLQPPPQKKVKSCRKPCLAQLSLTLSDLERSMQVTQVSSGLYLQISTELLLVMDRKSYMKFHLAPLSLTLSDRERSIQVTQVFNGLYLQIYSR